MNNYNLMNPYQAQSGYQPDHMKNLCHQYMNYHVLGQLSDGSQIEGIIDRMDEEGVTMLVPEEIEADHDRFGYGFNNNNGYDYDGYGRPRRRRFRRYRRRRFPYQFLLGLLPYPFYFPPYPYGFGYGGY